MTFREELKRFVQTTSVKGVSRVFRAETTGIRLLWVVAIVSCMTFGFQQVYTLLDDYVSYDKVTQIEERVETIGHGNQAFPKLRVCFLNPFDLSLDLRPDESFSYYKELVQSKTSCDNCTNEDIATLRAELFSANAYVRFIGLGRLRNMGLNHTRIIRDCKAFPSGEDCATIGNITVELSSKYIACSYVAFPRGMRVSSVSMTFVINNFQNLGGPKMYLSNEESTVLSSGVYYKVLAQRFNDNGVANRKSAPPGMRTAVDITKQVYRRLPSPYGNCVDKDEDEDEEYSIQVCLIRCFHRGIEENCSCVDVVTDPQLENPALDYCLDLRQPLLQILDKFNCIRSAYHKLTKKCYNTCQYKCVSTSYHTEATYSHWPLSYQHRSFYRQYIEGSSFAGRFDHLFQDDDSDNVNITARLNRLERELLIRQSFVLLSFKGDFLKYLEYVEVPRYTLTSLIGTLGGSLNLWTGITVLAFIEVIEVAVRIIKNLFEGRMNAKNEVNTK